MHLTHIPHGQPCLIKSIVPLFASVITSDCTAGADSAFIERLIRGRGFYRENDNITTFRIKINFSSSSVNVVKPSNNAVLRTTSQFALYYSARDRCRMWLIFGGED